MTKINLNLIAVVCLGVLLLDTAVNGGRITSDDVSRESPVQEVTDRTVRKGDLPSSEWKTLKRSKYLTYLFRKYGSGGLITFEGLEHMMFNLGLGGLEFTPNHAIEEHHPAGYRVYEDSLRDEEVKLTSTSPSTERTTGTRYVEIKIDGEGASEEIVIKEDRKDKKHDAITVTVMEGMKKDSDQEEKAVGSDLDDKVEEPAEDKDSLESANLEQVKEQQTFFSIHDPKHRHLNNKDHHHGTGTMSCLSPSALIKLLLLQNKPGYLYTVDRHAHQQQQPPRSHKERRHVNHYQVDEDDLLDVDVNTLTITPTDFVDVLCPALITQIERAECVVKKIDPLATGDAIKSEKKLFQFAWLYATISILIISMCGLVGVAIVPLMRSSSYNDILGFLVAVAVGTLAGDALMHLLPHALTPHLDHGDDTLPSDHKNDEAVYLCAFAFLAAVIMYILESGLPLLLGRESHGHSHHSHHHHHHEEPPHGRDRRSSSIIQEEMTLEPGKIFRTPEIEQDLNLQSEDMLKVHQDPPLTPVALMVIIGDGLHNITDGLAVGAAFALDPITGMATALAVLSHELPHELGDFALLLQTGVSIKRALILNVISSVLSLIGMAFGLFIAGIHTSLVRWIYAATAGTFLYIALADLIPEMGRQPEGKSLKSVTLQVTGILIGGLIMLTIALNEDRLRILFE